MNRLNRRTLIHMLGIATVLHTAATASADPVESDPKLESFLDEIARARADLRTLRGPFTQTRTIGLLSSSVRSVGTLTLVRPDRLRWELGSPDDVIYWMVPEGLGYKSKTGQGRIPKGQAGDIKTGQLDDLRTLIGGDLRHLRSRYELKLSSSDSKSTTLEATAKDKVRQRLHRLVLTFDSSVSMAAFPSRALLFEGARDRTEIAFGTLERNPSIDLQTMRIPF